MFSVRTGTVTYITIYVYGRLLYTIPVKVFSWLNLRSKNSQDYEFKLEKQVLLHDAYTFHL